MKEIPVEELIAPYEGIDPKIHALLSNSIDRMRKSAGITHQIGFALKARLRY